MPAERIGMRDAREIIRLKFSGVSTHEIARRLGMARSTVREMFKRMEGAGLDLAAAGRHERRGAGGGALRQPAQQARPPADRGAGLGRRASRTEAQACHPSDPVGRIHRHQPRRLPLLALCCGPTYVSLLAQLPLHVTRYAGSARPQHFGSCGRRCG